MSKYSLSWFAMMAFAGLLTACGQQAQDEGTQGMGAEPGQEREQAVPVEPGSPPPPSNP